MNWKSTDQNLPPEGVKIMTKIDDKGGCRNEQILIREGRLWFTHDMAMYVYYSPTHWRFKEAI